MWTIDFMCVIAKCIAHLTSQDDVLSALISYSYSYSPSTFTLPYASKRFNTTSHTPTGPNSYPYPSEPPNNNPILSPSSPGLSPGKGSFHKPDMKG